MGDFSAGWLALREPADHAARSPDVVRAIAGAIDPGELRVLDLGAGTGSNLRYLVSRLPQPQQWLLVDRDAALLAHAAHVRLPREGTVETRQVDLSDLAGASVRTLFDGRDLVTASALLDLVSERWLSALAARCREAGAAALFALSYDGRIDCAPGDEDDELVRRLVNEHQRGDKGFGPALGPAASDGAQRAFAALGYRVQRDRSDWLLGPETEALQRQLIDGWAFAATEAAPARAAQIDDWRARRLARVIRRESTLRVGHEDLAAWLPHSNRRSRSTHGSTSSP